MLTVSVLFPSRNALASQAVTDGLTRAFPEARVERFESVDEAVLNHTSESKGLMILIEPELAEIELAVKTSLEDGAPRWPVVSLGDAVKSSGLAVIPSEDWHPALLAQVFRMTLQQHDLVRENTRLRGDVFTVARRISHDLRTPLSGVFTTAELLKEIIAETSEEDAALTEPLFDSAQAMLKLIERVSQVMKASVDARPKEDVSMGSLVWTARQGVEKSAIERKVRINEPEEWPAVTGVSTWLETIWGNLLSNAVLHGTRGGTVEVVWRELADAFEFSVEDQGPGVSPEKRAGLFFPFEKLHQSHSSRGLGLSIVRRLVELQGGGCSYESIEGGGSRFSFTLPKAHAEFSSVA